MGWRWRLGTRSGEPKEHMVKMAELYRNEKLGEENLIDWRGFGEGAW